jgi:hypothetical protein
MKNFLLNKIVFIIGFSLISIFVYRHYINNYKYYEIFKNYGDSIKAKSQTDIILFGSSIENHTDYESESSFRISEILDTLTKKKVRHISNPGFYMPVYYSFIKSISSAQNTKPLTLIVPINMRSFSITWYGSRYNQFRDIDLALSPQTFINKEYFNVKNSKKIKIGCNTDISLDYFMASFFLSSNDNNLEKCVYYDYLIKPNNFVLNYLIKITNIKSKNLNIVFYFEPLDYLNLTENQRISLNQNINFLKKLLDEKRHEYIDLSKSIDSGLFDYKKTFNEHTKQFGKYLTAKHLNDSISFY